MMGLEQAKKALDLASMCIASTEQEFWEETDTAKISDEEKALKQLESDLHTILLSLERRAGSESDYRVPTRVKDLAALREVTSLEKYVENIIRTDGPEKISVGKTGLSQNTIRLHLEGIDDIDELLTHDFLEQPDIVRFAGEVFDLEVSTAPSTSGVTVSRFEDSSGDPPIFSNEGLADLRRELSGKVSK